ncbi:hypothetical protein [Taylorella asinigenitalis]|uniref:Uncharacterized protein n=1 Tax=Taylorella asinigenitalis (strain MCE3) TaxID=1008459 RepID=G4QB70_TAYAM|nr:hypothetical protein [Taylorella asinigenitalis]AEP36611.1 hypothetical protein TASI_0842 [Taylorella asinigenitalis MCE3]
MKYKRVIISIIIAVIATLVFNLFSKHYPPDISQELFDQCYLSRPASAKLTPASAEKLCRSAVLEFQNSVSYDAFEEFYLDLYENFKRAYSHKYRNYDLFSNLSPSNKSIFSVMNSTIFKDASSDSAFQVSVPSFFDPANYKEYFVESDDYREIDEYIATYICMVYIYGQNYEEFPAQEDQFKICENRYNFLKNTLSFKEFIQAKFNYSRDLNKNLYYNTMYGIPTPEE